MCLAISGKLVKIDGKKAVVDFSGEKKEVMLATDDVKIGDLVLVQFGMVIEKVSEDSQLQ